MMVDPPRPLVVADVARIVAGNVSLLGQLADAPATRTGAGVRVHRDRSCAGLVADPFRELLTGQFTPTARLAGCPACRATVQVARLGSLTVVWQKMEAEWAEQQVMDDWSFASPAVQLDVRWAPVGRFLPDMFATVPDVPDRDRRRWQAQARRWAKSLLATVGGPAQPGPVAVLYAVPDLHSADLISSYNGPDAPTLLRRVAPLRWLEGPGFAAVVLSGQSDAIAAVSAAVTAAASSWRPVRLVPVPLPTCPAADLVWQVAQAGWHSVEVPVPELLRAASDALAGTGRPGAAAVRS